MAEHNWDSIRETALYINYWANRTFKQRNPDSSLFKLNMEEIPELLLHKRQDGTGNIGGELADCLILLFDLGVIWGVDIPNALRDKMQLNERRMWTYDENAGYYNHADLRPKIAPVDSEGGETD